MDRCPARLAQAAACDKGPSAARGLGTGRTRPGGRIAIVDLAPHGREELRDVHAHARLGFADEAMAHMLAEAGFAPHVPRTLDGGDLTIKVWTATRGALSARKQPMPSGSAQIPSLSL